MLLSEPLHSGRHTAALARRAPASVASGLQAKQPAQAVVDLLGEGWSDAPAPMTERCRISESDAREVDGPAIGKGARQREKYDGNVSVCPVVDQHDDGIRAGEGVRADDQDSDAAAAEPVVDHITPCGPPA